MCDDLDFLDLYDSDDDAELCEHCGKPMTRDFEGDCDVINGTNDFWICEHCDGTGQTEEITGDE